MTRFDWPTPPVGVSYIEMVAQHKAIIERA
jgi:hypothetical protein